jgi:hypothetical protein
VSEERFPELGPNEREVAGRWLVMGDGGTADDVERRIRWLVSVRLMPLGTAGDGWDWLFRDPRDGRLWELTFPESSVHGSGPRRLAVISPAAARSRYPLAHVD